MNFQEILLSEISPSPMKRRKGHVISEETKAKLRAAATGRPVSDATRAKISALKKGNQSHLDKPHSEEAKMKISKALKGKKSGPLCRLWKGGRYHDCDGYVLVYSPNHPSANRKGHVLEHRLIMEEHLGRFLSAEEVVHHINGIRDDNRWENLDLFSSQTEHRRFHGKGE
jgi:hypothetical protein